MPKKSNAFAKYLFSLKDLHPEKSMAELQKIAGENWMNMDNNERDKYKTNGKDAKVDNRVRYNCLGQSIEQAKQIDESKRMKQLKDAEFIENFIKSYIVKNNLLSEEIYFFSASYHYKKSDTDIYPAEIAIAKFNLGEGITDVFHMFINPGPLPLGAAYTALENSKKTHHLPSPPNTIGEKNYHKVLDEILKFLEVKELCSTYVKPFFVYNGFQGDEFEAAKMTLQKIADENKCNNGFRVLEAEYFLYSLNRQVLTHLNKDDQTPIRSVIEAKDAMRHDNYRYADIGCDVHCEDDNSQNCALSKVKRWGYSIVEHCGLNCIERIPGQHMPPSNDINYDDFEDDDNLESCVTESFHQINLISSCSQTDTQSLLSEYRASSSFSSDLNMSVKSTERFINRLPSKCRFALKNSDSTITTAPSVASEQTRSIFSSMKSVTNIDDTVENYGESWTKNIMKDHYGLLED